MLNIRPLQRPALTEFLKIDFNKGIYRFYHELIKPNYNIEIENIEDFIFSVYEDALVFIDNYEALPYEADDYLKNKIEASKHNLCVLDAVRYSLVNEVIYILTGNLLRKKDGLRVFKEAEYFSDNGKWEFVKSLYNNLYTCAGNELNLSGESFYDVVIGALFEYVDLTPTNTKEINEFQTFVYSLGSTDKAKKGICEVGKIKPLLINGFKPNISERYKIADEVLNLYENINSKNISATEKHILLAHILGCSQQVARELFNGTQVKRTPIRENLINEYLKKLK